MKEVRMTFGEHLEELRRRILVSLLYLVVGVVLAFIFDKELMDVALTPHEQAFTVAQRSRLLTRFERILTGMEPLKTMDPAGAELDGKPLVEGPIRWEVLFAEDVALRALVLQVSEPFREFTAHLDGAFPSLPANERHRLDQAVVELGSDLAERLAGHLTPSVAGGATGNIPARLRLIEQRFRALADGDTRQGGLGRLLDWGGRLPSAVERLAEFNRFLDARRAQVLASGATAGEVEALATSTGGIRAALLDITERLEKLLEEVKSAEKARIMAISYLEQFYSHLKVAVVFGFLFTFPFILYEMWKFVGAGLYIHEQRYVVTFLPFSLFLFAAGAFFGYKVLIPVALTFLASWGDAEIELAFTLGNYIGLFFTLTFVLGLVFQTPLVMVFLSRIGAVSIQGFRRARKGAILTAVVCSAVLTPPDPFSQLLMALPMVFLYELGILICIFLSRRTKESAA